MRMRDTLQASLKTQLSNCPCKIWKLMNMRDTLQASLNTQLSTCPCKIWQLGKKKISQRNPVAKTENDSRDPSATLPSATFTAMRSVMVLLAETNPFLNFRNLWGPLYKKHSLNCPYPFTSPRQFHPWSCLSKCCFLLLCCCLGHQTSAGLKNSAFK